MSRIKAIVLDVDGVLTDGSFVWGPAGEEFKRFSFRDVMGVSLARKAGLILALVSGESTPHVDRFALKMDIRDVHKGCMDKASALREFAASHELSLDDICFVGDDVNDVPALAIAGFAATPADAHPAAMREADYIAKSGGGRGAVREIVDHLMGDQADVDCA